MSKYTYAIEYRQHSDHPWKGLFLYRDVPKTWAQGWLAHHRDAPGPRLGFRLVRSDGKVMEEVSGREDVSLGMVAGWPTWEQYVAAAIRALDTAAQVAHRQGTLTPEKLQELREVSRRLFAVLQREES